MIYQGDSNFPIIHKFGILYSLNLEINDLSFSDISLNSMYNNKLKFVLKMIQLIFSIDVKQECIPVGCVPSAAVAGGQGDVCPGGGVCSGGSAQGVSGRHTPTVDRILDTRL